MAVSQSFTNSPLVTCTLLSPNHSGQRVHDIDTITIHCAVAQWTAQRICEHFNKASRGASCNYAIGYDGSIGLCVEEKNRSWCSSSSSNDQRAITIEVASDVYSPYAVTDEALSSLIELVADVCSRNNIKELKWEADKSLIGQIERQNMTVHRWFANKSCPGDYLYGKHPFIVEEVNKRLRTIFNSDSSINETDVVLPTIQAPVPTEYKIGEEVKLIEGAKYITGVPIPKWVINKTIYVRGIRDNGDVVISTLQTGSITGVVSSKYLSKKNISAPPVIKPVLPKANDIVKIAENATYYNGKSIPSWVKNKNWIVSSVNGDKAIIDKSVDGKNSICSPIKVKDLIVVKESYLKSPTIGSATSKFSPIYKKD